MSLSRLTAVGVESRVYLLFFFWFLFLKNRTVGETETNFGSSRFEVGEVRSWVIAGLFLIPSFG